MPVGKGGTRKSAWDCSLQVRCKLVATLGFSPSTSTVVCQTSARLPQAVMKFTFTDRSLCLSETHSMEKEDVVKSKS